MAVWDKFPAFPEWEWIRKKKQSILTFYFKKIKLFITMIYVAGSNVFKQWANKSCVLNNFQKLSGQIDEKKCELCIISWSYNIFCLDGKFYAYGFWQGKLNQMEELNIPGECSKPYESLILAGNDYNLFIFDSYSHTMFTMDLREEYTMKKVNLNVEVPLAPKRMRREKTLRVLKAVVTNNSLIYLRMDGLVYSGFLPSYLDTSHCEGNVCDVECGYEHFVLLTDTGKVYTWGNGRRLQLGHGDICNLESPTEVEALGGIRITKIRAGGWHTLALSESGDLYTWGWNDMGQLGITEKENSVSSCILPTLVDIYNEEGNQIEHNVIDIGCGSRHSAVILEDNSVWTSGCNKYGQLGLSPDEHVRINSYRKVFVLCDSSYGNKFTMRCGPWCTALQES